MNQTYNDLIEKGGWAENDPMNVPMEEILSLSVQERLDLVAEIWDSIAPDAVSIPLTSAQRDELDRRQREHHKDPSAARPWSEVRDRLLKRNK